MGTAKDMLSALDISTPNPEQLRLVNDFIALDITTYWKNLSSTVMSILCKEGVLRSKAVTRSLHIFSDSFVEGEHVFTTLKDQFPNSPHVQLIEKLVMYGGIIHDTEHADKHRACLQMIIAHGLSFEADLALLIDERDRYIAKNIDARLPEDEHAILFMGALHNVPQYLPQSIDIKVIHRADVISSRVWKLPEKFTAMFLKGFFNRPDSYGHKLSPMTL
jgi:hypothetical protein